MPPIQTGNPQQAPSSGGFDPMGLRTFARNLFSSGGDPAAAAPADPYDVKNEQSKAAMLEYFKTAKEECFDQRWVFERIWWRNLLYMNNRQWIYYDQTRNQWQDKRLARWIPRPVTNKCADTALAIRSVFANVQLAINCRPNGENPTDIMAAETAENYSPVVQADHDIVRVMRDADGWLTDTGNAFLHPRWDKRSEWGVITIALEQCLTCGKNYGPAEIQDAGGVCPECQTGMFAPATNPDGSPAVRRYAKGKGVTDVLSPFEVAGPMSYTRADQWPYLVRLRWRPKHWWRKNYPDLVKGMKFDKMPQDRSLQLLRSIPSASEIGTQPITREAGPDGNMIEGITEYELWAKPSKEYPRGLYLRITGEKGNESILDLPDEPCAGPLPYATEQGDPIWPWIHIPYEQMQGKVWGRSPIDLIIQKQDQLNQLDSLTMLIVNRVANPVWLEPRGADVKKFTGEPGLIVKWNPLVGMQAKPERIEGQNVPSSIFQIRQQLLDDIEALSGTYDVIKGAQPSGVDAFSALQLLVERSQSRFAMVLQERGEAFRKWYRIALELERTYGPEERVESVLGPNNAWTFQKFKMADLNGNISITIEDGSQAPKTNLGKRAAVEQLRNFGVIDPTTDPDQKYAILRTFGQTDLMPALNTHVQKALSEQDAWEKWAAQVQFAAPQPVMGPAGAMAVDPNTNQPMMGPPQPNIPYPHAVHSWNDNPIHILEHTKWLNGETVTQLLAAKPQLMPYAEAMILDHEKAQMAKQMQMAMMAAGGGQAPQVGLPPAPGPGGPPGGPAKEAGGGANALSSSNRESGNPRDVPRGTSGPGAPQ